MPIYEYMCKDCGHVSEFLVKTMSEGDNQSCSHCGSGDMQKLLSAPSLLKESTALHSHTCCGREERCEISPCSTGEQCRRH